MTAQIPETLIYRGEQHSLCTEPLSRYFLLANIRPKFLWETTALWRGYVGTWEITHDRLYLRKLEGTLEGGTDVTLETFFPGFPDRVFAHWFSGTLRIPQGEMVDYVHMGYSTTYEQDLLLKVSSGVVVAQEIRNNRGPAIADYPGQAEE